MSSGVGGSQADAGEVVRRVHAVLSGRGETVAVAESLTGGELCAALTAPAGASAVVRGALVVYATDLKNDLAGVDAELLARRGAVDPEVARQLAVGVRDRLGASYGVGVTGVAGPDPQDGQEVGTVFGAVSGPAGTEVAAWQLSGDRAVVRAAAVRGCLELLLAAAGEDRGPGRAES